MRSGQETVRSRRDRTPSRSAFRKPCRSRFQSHPSQFQPLAKSARTCFEGPFGEVLRGTGSVAKAHPFRFSTKFQDDETDLLYYGYRYYCASTGRWNSRDPVEEITRLAAIQWLARVGITPWVSPAGSARNPYHFVSNDSIDSTDYLGMESNNRPPEEGDPCCGRPCEAAAKFTRVSVAPILAGGGIFSKPRAISWTIIVKVNYVTQGDCQVLGCKYWTCNLGLPRGTPSAYTSGPCGGWTYPVGGPVSENYHAKAMEGVIEYLSCEHGQYVKKELSAGSLQQGFYYSPPEAWSGGERLYP